MEFEILGSPEEGPTLDLDHEQFAYAGKFVMSDSGKSVARDGGRLVGAAAFNEDRTDDRTVRLRYVTVRADRRGEGVGSRLLRFTAARLQDRYEEVLIAANNPIAYRACYRAGFVFTGRETGIAEVLLRYAPDAERSTEEYRAGLGIFEGRDLPPDQRDALDAALAGEPPPIVADPGADG